MKMRRKKGINKCFVIIFLIFINTFLIINYIGNKMTPIMDELVVKSVNKSMYSYIFNTFNKEVMTNVDINEILYLTVNKEGEILSIDYRFDKAYQVLSDSLNTLFININDMKIDSVYYDDNKGIFFVPVGIITNNVLLNNLGSKIPCKVVYLTDIQMGFKTKVSNYGINNVLMELYVVIETKNKLINPMETYEFGEKKEVVVASKVIMGNIPSIYGGQIEKSSAIVSS